MVCFNPVSAETLFVIFAKAAYAAFIQAFSPHSGNKAKYT
jgi:hypothetical protein